MNIRAPDSYIVSICEVHSTLDAICGANLANISAFESPPLSIGYHFPSTLLVIGILGQLISRFSKNLLSGSFAGATIREWKAWLVGKITQLNPSPSNLDMAALTGSVSPAITVIFGEFLFAAITYPSISDNISAILSYGAVTLAIKPLSSISTLPISVPRAAAALNAPSMSSIPALISAAYSPKL